MITKKYAYQRVRARSERTERNLLALIEVILVDVALRGVLELAVVEVLHDRVLHLLLHVQGLKQIKNNYENNFFKERIPYIQVKEDSPRKQFLINASTIAHKRFLKQNHKRVG
jgi:hypothetical protein